MMMKPLTLLLILFSLLSIHSPGSAQDSIDRIDLRETISALSSFGSRKTGSPGYQKSLEYIKKRLENLGLETKPYLYQLPIRKTLAAEITVEGRKYSLRPFINNAITPQTTAATVQAPLYYVGKGELSELDGKSLRNSVVLIDFDSGRNWQQLAAVGVKAAIFIKSESLTNTILYREKHELTPLRFPCFLMDKQQAAEIFGPLENTSRPLKKNISLYTRSVWENILAENLYAIIPGREKNFEDEILIIESFFDSEEFVEGESPGADASSSLATFLSLAKSFTESPPDRSVLLLATSGHAQTLAGMRDIVWSLNSRSKDLQKQKRQLTEIEKTAQQGSTILQHITFPLSPDSARDEELLEAIKQSLSFEVDTISRELNNLRLQEKNDVTQGQIKQLALQRFSLRQLSWLNSFHDLQPSQIELLSAIVPKALARQQQAISGAEQQLRALRSAFEFRQSLSHYETKIFASLHLSSHGNGVGAFNRGWLYNLKKNVNRTSIYATLADVLENVSPPPKPGLRYQNSLRPSHRRSWDSWFFDRPQLAGEVSALAGYLGFSLMTTGDSRALWGTPDDTTQHIDWNYLADQAELITILLRGLARAPALHDGRFPRDGFVTVTGRSNLLLQGELFANYPAENTTILGYQGLNKFYSMVDSSGYFQIKGLADKKNVLDKLIIEGYKFDHQSGKTVWAIDKKLTGKSNYRLKLLRKSMMTDLVLFPCQETTLFNLLEPRNFSYLTKLRIFDGRRDAPPEHYWYSRIDTRESIILGIFTEPGTHVKITLSDTVLTNKLIFTNGQKTRPAGFGYRNDSYPIIENTLLHAARDIWTLLQPRIDNLEHHGIFDEKISQLTARGLAALRSSEGNYAKNIYSAGRKDAADALAYADKVYVQVEKTQKDVLWGVLFYVALFVPFAFVMERFLFNFNTIYKRILGFTVILVLLITVIYNVHPAFRLAYSPMIVVLAFFIIGLSFMVTLIIFFRFEKEMILMQKRSTHKNSEEISKWKAFVAAFFLGVSNLRRRKLRSLLTCTTLVILTFTIMSFTTIKSTRSQVRLSFQGTAPYSGLLLKDMNWKSLPPQAADFLMASMPQNSISAPRIWLEGLTPTSPLSIPLRRLDKEIEIQGLIGLSPQEAEVTGIDKILLAGRWFEQGDRSSIILERNMARRLNITQMGQEQILLWGTPFTVIGTFDGYDLEQATDLDGEILTPAIFPDEANTELSEEEMEAFESGDDVRSYQSRYQHIGGTQTAIIPAATLLAAGGKFKSIAVAAAGDNRPGEIASQLSDRFNLAIFSGESDGVWLYNLSDTMKYSGVPNIVIPLLLSVLIVLNTMISSVYERKNEIHVYTSVGLAPSHVGFLFVAEALALAVISVVVGYLLAQVMAAVMVNTSLWQGITVNYSSSAGVAAMLLVIVVVLVSVTYPSRVASRIAIPDVNQTFTLPPAVDNRIIVTLPFLMKYQEHQSIGGFIHDYFISHQEVSHGIFSTGPVEVLFSCSTVDELAKLIREDKEKEDLHCLHIRSNVWLAPFDFGILQTVDVQFCPAAEGEDFLEIKITLARQAGEADIWKRINTAFLHELRKQLLIWRSLDTEVHKQLEQSFTAVISGNS